MDLIVLWPTQLKILGEPWLTHPTHATVTHVVYNVSLV